MGNLPTTIPLSLTLGYQPDRWDPWPNNWNSPELTDQLTQALNTWNSWLYYISFEATRDPITATTQYLNLGMVTYPKFNVTKII